MLVILMKKLERYELEKQKELLIILQKETNYLKRTLPYWKNWKKTEQKFLSAAGGSSIKAFDPCLDTGEVGEGPAVEEVGEPVIESPVKVEEVVAGGSSTKRL